MDAAFADAGRTDRAETLTAEQLAWVSAVADNAQSQKAVLAALLTSLLKKVETPAQDVRLHKVEMPGGYSGRVFDTHHVTPFIARHFPRLAMKSGSGWLTRSLEQNHPFDLSFPGKIQVAAVKTAFLEILNDVEEDGADARAYLVATLAALVRMAQMPQAAIAVTAEAGSAGIATIIVLVSEHLFAVYKGAGASRLPVLAIYAAYELILESSRRYDGKQLLPLKSHTTSDTKSRSIGDIEIGDASGAFYEAVEVKHRIAITPTLVRAAYDKFRALPLSRYYLLTTAMPDVAPADAAAVAALCAEIRRDHGCEVIVNGVLPSLKYYLRLVPNPGAFLERYTAALEADFAAGTDIKQTHIERWRELLGGAADNSQSLDSRHSEAV